MNNKITIEEINGIDHTVIWCDKHKLGGYWRPVFLGYVAHKTHVEITDFGTKCEQIYIATALPPLPRRPELKHARLFDLYRAHKVRIAMQENSGKFRKGLFVGLIDECSTESGVFVVQEQYPDEQGDQRVISLRENITKITHAIHADTGERVDIAIREDV